MCLRDPSASSPFSDRQLEVVLSAVQLMGHLAEQKRWPALLLQDDAVEEAVARLDKAEVSRMIILVE